jgi:hypothetical protein
MALLYNWDIDFTGPSLSYVSNFASQLIDWTQRLGVRSPDVNWTQQLTPVLLSAEGSTLIDDAVYVEDAQGGYWTLASGDPVDPALLNAKPAEAAKTEAGAGGG